MAIRKAQEAWKTKGIFNTKQLNITWIILSKISQAVNKKCVNVLGFFAHIHNQREKIEFSLKHKFFAIYREGEMQSGGQFFLISCSRVVFNPLPLLNVTDMFEKGLIRIIEMYLHFEFLNA